MSNIYLIDYSVWNGVPKILVNSDLTQSVSYSNLRKGAIKVHEAAYAVARLLWANGSALSPELIKRTSETVGYLVSDNLSVGHKAHLRSLTKLETSSELLGYRFIARESFILNLTCSTNGCFRTALRDGKLIDVPALRNESGAWLPMPGHEATLYISAEGTDFDRKDQFIYSVSLKAGERFEYLRNTEGGITLKSISELKKITFTPDSTLEITASNFSGLFIIEETSN